MNQFPRDIGRWLDHLGRKYSLSLRHYCSDSPHKPLGHGILLAASVLSDSGEPISLDVAAGFNDAILDLNSTFLRAGPTPEVRVRQLEDVLIGAFRQAVFYGWLEGKSKMDLWDEPNALKFHFEPRPISGDSVMRFWFDKEETYLMEVAAEIRAEIMHHLCREYRNGMGKAALRDALMLDPDVVNPELLWLKDQGLIVLASSPDTDVLDTATITEEGARWVQERRTEENHEADIRGLDSMTKTEFILPAGDDFRAKMLVLRVMQLAKTRLLIVDEYLDDKVFPFLEALGSSVAVRLLTGGRKPMFKTLLDALKKNRSGVEARECSQCHDRYLVIDDKDVWHIGTSINGLGAKASRLSRVADDEERRRFQAECSAWWTNGTPI